MSEKNERDPYAVKVAEENARFVESLPSLFETMAEMLPEEERELFQAAAGEVGESIRKGAEELRSGAVDDALVARKPPALWELEKHMLNKSCDDLGLPPMIEDYEGDEDE